MKYAIRGKKEIIKAILESKKYVNLNIQNDKGETPLLIAANSGYHGDYELVKSFLEHGADPSIADRDGNTPLHIAIENLRFGYGYREIAKLLIDAGADVNYQGSCKDTALHKAAKAGNKDIVEVLLKVKGIKLDLVNDEGKAPLDIAKDKGHTKIVAFLEEITKKQSPDGKVESLDVQPGTSATQTVIDGIALD